MLVLIAVGEDDDRTLICASHSEAKLEDRKKKAERDLANALREWDAWDDTTLTWCAAHAEKHLELQTKYRLPIPIIPSEFVIEACPEYIPQPRD